VDCWRFPVETLAVGMALDSLVHANLNVLLGLAVVAVAILATLALTARRDDW
jgi:hypothetical protein